MKLEQISVNLYSLRDHLKTPETFRESIRKLGEIGFRSVQLSGIPLETLTHEQMNQICKDNGITITATHEPSDKILDDPQWSIERLKVFGVTETAYPYPGGVDLGDDAAVTPWLRKLEERKQLFEQHGIMLSYHNHHMEFTRLNGRLIMDRIIDETTLNLELDTYWVQLGGCDPVRWVERAASLGRLSILHLKDVRITPKGEAQFAELGAGNLDFDAIIAAAKQGGCEQFIIEQDQTYGRDTFEAVAESFEFLRSRYLS